MKLDTKFLGVIVENGDSTLVPADQWMVFVAKDNAVPATLKFYEEECIRQGAEQAQIDAVRALRIRVASWRAEHPELCKTPDVLPGELIAAPTPPLWK
jgi:hypothetical protein